MTGLEDYLNKDISDEKLAMISEKLINAKFDREKRNTWEQKLSKEYGVEKPPAQQSILKINRLRYILGLAASLLLLLAFYFLIFQATPKYQRLVQQHITQLEIMGDQSVLRKGPTEVKAIRKQATLSYVKEKYKESLGFWKLIALNPSATGIDYLYLALCELKQPNSDPQAAIQSLKKAQSLNGPQEEIAWVLALAYLDSGDQANGRALLLDIVKNKGYQQTAAAELLRLSATPQ